MKSLPYESAVAGAKALTDLQRTLENFGCTNFGTMVDSDEQTVTVAFKWRGQQVRLDASWRGYAAAWLKRHPYKYSSRSTRQQHEQRALDQARISVCSVLRDWAKAQTVAVECGALRFEDIFMPHMILTDGRRVVDRVREANIIPRLEYDA